MKALIDGDILRYELGCATNSQGEPLPWPLVKARVDGKIHSIAQKAGADTYTVYMSGDNNFRVGVATIKPYKGTRSSEKPYWHDEINEYLKSGLNHPVVVCDGYEADDGMSIEQSRLSFATVEELLETTIICSRDKDLHMVPGWHYSWGSGNQPEREPWYVNEKEGMKLFFLQLLTGDRTDNIPGLHMIGPVKAEKLLEGITEPLRMYAVVRAEYEARFGSYWNMFMHENAALLWMLWSDPEDYGAAPEQQIEDILDEFESELGNTDEF